MNDKTRKDMERLLRAMHDGLLHDEAEDNARKRRREDLVKETMAGLTDTELYTVIQMTTNVYSAPYPQIRFPGDQARSEALRRFLNRAAPVKP